MSSHSILTFLNSLNASVKFDLVSSISFELLCGFKRTRAIFEYVSKSSADISKVSGSRGSIISATHLFFSSLQPFFHKTGDPDADACNQHFERLLKYNTSQYKHTKFLCLAQLP